MITKPHDTQPPQLIHIPLSPHHPKGGPALRGVPSAHHVITPSLRRAAADGAVADGRRDDAVVESNHAHDPATLRGGARTRLGQAGARKGGVVAADAHSDVYTAAHAYACMPRSSPL